MTEKESLSSLLYGMAASSFSLRGPLYPISLTQLLHPSVKKNILLLNALAEVVKSLINL